MKIQEPANLGLDDLQVSMCIGVDNYSLLVSIPSPIIRGLVFVAFDE